MCNKSSLFNEQENIVTESGHRQMCLCFGYGQRVTATPWTPRIRVGLSLTGWFCAFSATTKKCVLV